MPVDMTALEEWIPASLGSLTIRKLLTALLLLAACLAAVRLVMTLVRRLAAKTSIDERVRRYFLSGCAPCCIF